MPPRDPSPRQPDPRPLPPAAPGPSACCGEGCAHCVLDLHEAAIEKYQAELAAWQARQSSADRTD